MNSEEAIKYAIYGVGGLLVLKYIVVGLCFWDKVLHPTRIEDPTSPFLQPFLGAFGTIGDCATTSATINYNPDGG